MSDTFHDYFPSRSKEDAYREFLGYPGKALGRYLGDGDSVRKALASATPSGIDTHAAYTRTDPRTGKLEQIKGNRTAAPKKPPPVSAAAAAFVRDAEADGSRFASEHDNVDVEMMVGREWLLDTLKRVFGSAIPPYRDFKAAFAPSKGFHVKIIDWDLDTFGVFGQNFMITATLHSDADGSEVGRMTRTFKRENGKLKVTHEKYVMDEKHRAQGIGATVLRNSLRWYKEIGVHSVDLEANGDPPVGRYVWASLGFSWSKDDAEQKRLALANHLEVDLGVKPKIVKQIMREVKTPWDIADLTIDGEKVGKKFLMDDTSWLGVLTLADGHPTYERAKEKLGL